MRPVTGLLLSLLLASNAGGEPLLELRESGTLSFAVYENFPPYSYHDGHRSTGLDIDVGHAIAAELGLEGVAKLVAADETMEDDLRNNVWKGHYIGGGVVDVMLHVPIDNAFAKDNDAVVITAPYLREQIVLARPKADATPGFDMSYFFDHRIGVELDTLADFYLLSAYQGRIRDNVVHFRSVGDAGDALQRGEVAGVLAPRGEVEGALGTTRDRFQISPVNLQGLGSSAWDIGLAIKASNRHLVAAIETAVEKLRDSGYLEQLFARHGLTYQAPVNTTPASAEARPAPRLQR